MTYTATDRRRIKDARSRKQRAYKRYIGIPTDLVPSGPAAAHVRDMYELGWSYKALDQLAGNTITYTTLSNLASGRHPTIERRTATAAITIPWTLAPTADVHDTALIPCLGAERRVLALMRMGYGHAHLRARRIESSHLARGTYRQMTAKKWRHVAAIYNELCMTPGPSTITATRARVAGHPGPLAWDNIDDPDATPQGHDKERGRSIWEVDRTIVNQLLAGRTVPSTPAEKAEAIRRWVAKGNSKRSLCKTHGWNDGRYGEGLEREPGWIEAVRKGDTGCTQCNRYAAQIRRDEADLITAMRSYEKAQATQKHIDKWTHEVTKRTAVRDGHRTILEDHQAECDSPEVAA